MNNYKFNKVAIITDNPYLAEKFYGILKAKGIIGVLEKVVIFCSPKSNPVDFFTKESIFVDTINLKKQTDIDHLTTNFELVFSIHCKQLFPKDLINTCKCINVHPGYNPINRGWFPQIFAIIHDLEIGATIHEIDEKLDHGAIIARRKVQKLATDTSEMLYERILAKELELIDEYIVSILNDTYTTVSMENEGNLFLKKDFETLKEIDLDKKVSFKEAIDYMRAMTFEKYDNAYFLDEKGEKVYLKISLYKK